MKLKFQYGSNGPIGRQLAAWQNSLFPGYVSFRRLQFHHQNRLIISLINKGANTWIITQPPYSHNFCRSKTAINNRELLYLFIIQFAWSSRGYNTVQGWAKGLHEVACTQAGSVIHAMFSPNTISTSVEEHLQSFSIWEQMPTYMYRVFEWNRD